MKNFFHKAGLVAVSLFATVFLSYAANLSFSTGSGFIPGPRLIDGSDLNVMVTAINNLQNTVGANPAILGSGVNQVSVSGAATTVAPVITTGGASADANIGIIVTGKGTGPVHLGGSTKTNGSARVVTVASAVNPVTLLGAVTGSPAVVQGGGGLSSDTDVGLSLLGSGVGIVTAGGTTTCTGTTTATCNAQRFTVSITGLTTAAGGTTSAAMVVANTSVASSAIHVVCQVNGYSGTGQPVATAVVPGTNQVSVSITNVAGSGSLNATVPVFCQVLG